MNRNRGRGLSCCWEGLRDYLKPGLEASPVEEMAAGPQLRVHIWIHAEGTLGSFHDFHRAGLEL